MLSFLKKAFTKIYTQVTNRLRGLFGRAVIDESALKELEAILISADTGVQTSRTIINQLRQDVRSGLITKGTDLEDALSKQLKQLLSHYPFDPQADVYLLVGINGSGKTTFAGKLGWWLSKKGKKPLFIAADTFRAAAPEQLSKWGETLSIPVIRGIEGQDPASVVFQGCETFKSGSFDALIIDTAGRLQTKTNLMKELEKIRRIIEKQLGQKRVCTLLTIDAMLGQNSFDQAKTFHESTHLDGVILTKMDGTGKGGIVFSIVHELKVPIAFISYGENADQVELFDTDTYIKELLG